MPNRSVIMVNNISITISEANAVKNWLRTKSTIEFLSTWEILYNPEFKVVESDHFKESTGYGDSSDNIALDNISC